MRGRERGTMRKAMSVCEINDDARQRAGQAGRRMMNEDEEAGERIRIWKQTDLDTSKVIDESMTVLHCPSAFRISILADANSESDELVIRAASRTTSSLVGSCRVIACACSSC